MITELFLGADIFAGGVAHTGKNTRTFDEFRL